MGAILAGGAGRRMGGDKAVRNLRGRPLIAYPAEALAAVCEPVAVVCKPGTVLPGDGSWQVWDDEPLEPRHPATGIVHALARAGGPVLVCAADMPFVTSDCCRRLVEAARSASAAAVVASVAGGLQPVLAVYSPLAAPVLLAAAERGEPLRRAVDALEPLRVELPDAALRSVDTPEALAEAERALGET